MIAMWMAYCSLCALGLALAAALAERALLTGRGPVRFVWISAVALSLVVPVVAFYMAPPEMAIVTPFSGSAGTRDVGRVTTPVTRATMGPSPRHVSPTGSWRAGLARADRPLAVMWGTLALAIALHLLGGVMALAKVRLGWQQRTVLGVPVFVSESTGPAVVGAVAPAIVLPRWVLGLTSRQLALMLRHEQEHLRAGDGRILAVAHLALIAMPWNLALWWQVLRLRGAVELDCDARVLRDADLRSYGNLLLDVARPRLGASLTGATAFAERATQLERRIRVLRRHSARTSSAARATAAVIGLAAVTIAWIVPRPPAPARVSASPASTLTATIWQSAAPKDQSAPTGPHLVDSAFSRLFEGIPLTQTQETTALRILVGLVVKQENERHRPVGDYLNLRPTRPSLSFQRDSTMRTSSAVEPRRLADAVSGLVSVRAPSDSALIALVSNDADRARLRSRIVSVRQ